MQWSVASPQWQAVHHVVVWGLKVWMCVSALLLSSHFSRGGAGGVKSKEGWGYGV